ncbi:hypothetical protein EPO04_03740 [Patescibacteria group bacterium]|nr:MAG: hypothetical protein EPO04_03740 [Patescibacteria group bacterium]
MPDPTPDGLLDQKAVEASLMALDERAKAEQQYMHEQLEAGIRPSQLLEQLGGKEEAARIIGEYYADELASNPEDREFNEWVNILELHNNGATAQQIIDRYGGREELERVLGTKAAQGFVEDARQELKGDN